MLDPMCAHAVLVTGLMVPEMCAVSCLGNPYLSPSSCELPHARRGSARALCSRRRPSGWLHAAACNRCFGRCPRARRLGAGELAVCKAGERASPSVGRQFLWRGAGRCGSRAPSNALHAPPFSHVPPAPRQAALVSSTAGPPDAAPYAVVAIGLLKLGQVLLGEE